MKKDTVLIINKGKINSYTTGATKCDKCGLWYDTNEWYTIQLQDFIPKYNSSTGKTNQITICSNCYNKFNIY